jgi:hypothetical protein
MAYNKIVFFRFDLWGCLLAAILLFHSGHFIGLEKMLGINQNQVVAGSKGTIHLSVLFKVLTPRVEDLPRPNRCLHPLLFPSLVRPTWQCFLRPGQGGVMC